MKKQGSGVRGQGSGRRPGISAATVRKFLREFPGSAVLEAAEHLQVQTHREHDRVKQILHDLVRSGAVMRECERDFITYRLTGKPARGAVQAKLWEFACLRFAAGKPFGAAEAARLAECDRDYTKRYYRWLWQSAYLAIITRARAGAPLYQVVGGKEHEAAPAWNRRAEKRKSRGQGPGVRGQEECKDWSPQAGCMGTPQTCDRACPLDLPEAPPPAAVAGIICRNPSIAFFDEGIKGQKPEAPPEAGDSKTIMRAALEAAGITGPRERLDAALEDFGRALVEVTGSIGRAWEIIREMNGELFALAAEEQGHDEPGEPTDGHH